MTNEERVKLEQLVAKVFTLAYELGTNTDQLLERLGSLGLKQKIEI